MGESDPKDERGRMRERALRFWLAAVGHPVVLKMQEKYFWFPFHFCFSFFIILLYCI